MSNINEACGLCDECKSGIQCRESVMWEGMIITGDLVSLDEPTSPNFGKVGVVVELTPTTAVVAPTRLAPTGRTWRKNMDGSDTEYRLSSLRRTCIRPESGHLTQGAYWTVTSS